MIVGTKFAKLFETSHGQLLVHLDPCVGAGKGNTLLFETMLLEDRVVRQSTVGSDEQVQTHFDNYATLEAEEAALKMSLTFERSPMRLQRQAPAVVEHHAHTEEF